MVVRHFIVFVLLAIVSVACFLPDMSAYFMSDDFQFISYVADHLRHDPIGLLKNLWSCSFDLAYSQHYRPLIVLPYIFDWLIWGNNPVGWHLTNLVLHVGASFCVYLLGLQLLQGFKPGTACTASAFAAAVFASAPQHAEPVISIVCRVDSICTIFSLLTLVFFLKLRRNSSKSLYAATLCFFVLSICSKESAATLPLIFALICFIGDLEHSSFSKAFTSTLKETRIFWLILVAYIGIRALALGTLIGGYTGATGILLDACRIERWTNPTLLASIIFPVNVVDPGGNLVQTLALVYVALGVALLFRVFASRVFRHEIYLYVFLFGWFLISLLPVAQAWWINYAMLGGRHLYLPSVPLCLMLGAMLLKAMDQEAQNKLTKLSTVTSIAALVSLVGIYTVINIANDKAWVEASEQSRTLIAAVEKECEKLSPTQKILVLNMPVFYRGVLCFFFSDAIRPAFREYFCKADYSNKVITLEPQNLFPVLVNRPLLERILDQPETYKVFRWNTDSKTLTPFLCDRNSVDFPHVLSMRNKELFNHPRCTTFSIDAIPKINPWKFDGLKTVIGSEGTPGFSIYKPFSSLTWNDRQNYSGYIDEQLDPVLATPFARFNSEKPTDYKYFLDEHLDWLMSNAINRLTLRVWSSRNEVMSAVEQFSNKEMIPKLEPDEATLKLDYDGAYLPINTDSKDSHAVNVATDLRLKYDASAIPSATHVSVELSAPFDRFEIPKPTLAVSPTFHSTEFCPRAAKRWTIAATKGDVSIQSKDLPARGHYQVRIFAQAADESIVGYSSYPVTIANARTVEFE